jgi:hypothetical protein
MTSPGHLAPFDWEDFEDRYEKALQEADENEKHMLEEFERLVKVRRHPFYISDRLPLTFLPVLQCLGFGIVWP